MATRPPAHLNVQIGVATFSRLLINTARRFPYPFAPALSRGLGVPIESITALIAINQSTGLLSPFFGPLGDRLGYRPLILAGVGMLAAGMLAAGVWPSYVMIMLALFLAGLGKSIFDPALQAYIGQKVPFERRGMVIGMVEFSWALCTLVAIPLIGFLMEGFGWVAPFWLLGGLGLLSVAALAYLLPHEPPEPGRAIPWREAWGQLARNRAAMGGLVYIMLVNFATDNLFVVYGVWLENYFQLSVAALGTTTIVIGLAEFGGEWLTVLLADRFGPHRVVLIGLLASTLSYLVLPWMGESLPLALGGLFLVFILFEFTVVTSISLFTELAPNTRSAMMSAFLAAAAIGRVCGAFSGGLLWAGGGLWAVCLVSATASGLGLVCLRWGLRHWQR